MKNFLKLIDGVYIVLNVRYNLLLIFDEIKTFKINEEQGKELYNSAIKHLDDIMNSYGTVVNLKSKPNSPEKNYLNIYPI